MSDYDSSEYEYAAPVTIGGGAATYSLISPWNTPAEYATRVVSFSAPGGVAITYDGTTPAVTTTTATNLTGGQTGELYLMDATNPNPITPAALFAACPTNRLTITVTGTTTCLVTIHWRRRLRFAYMPDHYQINPDLVPESAVHAARAQDAINAEKHFNGR